MVSQTIKGEEFSVDLNGSTQTIHFKGTVRLQTGEDYAPIVALLNKGIEEASGELLLDFRQLNFLNSSGINAISKFVISARKDDRPGLKVIGNKDIYWQQKSLQNLQKLWAKVQIEIV